MGTARDRLTELWRRSGIPQVELDRRAGQGKQWVHNRIKGRATITADDIPILARALDKPITAFFADVPAGDQGEAGAINTAFRDGGIDVRLTAEEEALLDDAKVAIAHILVRHREAAS